MKDVSRMKGLVASVALCVAWAGGASAHELTIKAVSTKVEAGVPFEAAVHSSHAFIVPEEVEVLSRVTAGLFADGEIVASELRADEEDLCIDFTVTPTSDGTLILVATKDGETWCVTSEGGKTGARSELEAQGLKVLSAKKYDKYAKAIVNATKGDETSRAVVGHPLEIVPVTDPAEAKAGGRLHVKILLEGQPYTGPVWATWDGFAPGLTNTYAYYTEAESGEAWIELTAPGWWGVRAVASGLPGVEGDYDSRELRAFLLFAVE